MKYIKTALYLFVLAFLLHSCSPLKSSPKEEKHQMELTLHEVQTNLDDLRHDLNCFQTELQIIDGKIKHQESESQKIKSSYIEKQQNKIENLLKQLNSLDNKISSIENKNNSASNDINQLTTNANDTISALSQQKEKMNELERLVYSQNKKLEEVAKLKTTLETIAKSMQQNSNYTSVYKVKAGDSLEKIAKINQVSVEDIKKINNLNNDLIVIGQELKIP